MDDKKFSHNPYSNNLIPDQESTRDQFRKRLPPAYGDQKESLLYSTNSATIPKPRSKTCDYFGGRVERRIDSQRIKEILDKKTS